MTGAKERSRESIRSSHHRLARSRSFSERGLDALENRSRPVGAPRSRSREDRGIGRFVPSCDRLPQCRDDEFELFHSQNDGRCRRLLPPLIRTRAIGFLRSVKSSQRVAHSYIRCITLRIWVFDFGAIGRFFSQSSSAIGRILSSRSPQRGLEVVLDIRPVGLRRRIPFGQFFRHVPVANGTQYHATQLAQELAKRINATAILLQAPGLVGTAEARRVLSRDPAVLQASSLFESIDLALVGIGSMEPSKLLSSSGNVFSHTEREELSNQGAVGDILDTGDDLAYI